MAEDFGAEDSEMEITVVGDWSRFDEEARRRQEQANQFGTTFASEGFTPRFGGPLPQNRQLPYYPEAGQRQADTSRLQTALERLTNVLERPGIGGGAGPVRLSIPSRYDMESFEGGFGGALPPPGGFGAGGGAGGGGSGAGALALAGGGFGGAAGGGGGFVPPGYGGIFNAGYIGPNSPWPGLAPGASSPYPRRGRIGGIRSWYVLEAVRAGADVAAALRQQNITEQLSLGDPSQLALAQLQARQSIAHDVPFGMGMLAEVINDPFGSEELSVRLPLAQAQQADQMIQGRRQMTEFTRNLQVSTRELETPRGQATRQLQIQTQFEQTNQQIRQQVGQESDRNTQQINSMREEARARVPLWRRATEYGLGVIGVRFGGVDEGPAGISDQDAQGITTAQAGLRAGTARREQQLRTEAQRVRDLAAQRGQQEEHLNQMDIAGQALGAALNIATPIDISEFGLFSRRGRETATRRTEEIQRSVLANAQARELERVRTFEPQREEVVRNALTVERLSAEQDIRQDRARLEIELNREEFMARTRVTGGIQVAQLEGAQRPDDARLMQLQMQNIMAVRAADPADRPGLQRLGEALVQSMVQTQARQAAASQIGIATENAALDFQLQRQPLQARLEQIRGRAEVEEMLAPRDRPGLIEGIQRRERSEEALATREFNDRRYLETMSLNREQNVTALLAQAYGPGAFAFQMTARVTEIGGQAEQRAQARTIADATDTANAQRERQIGINRLRGLQASYIQGFTPEEGSLYRTNLSPDTSTSPARVFDEIKTAIDNLSAKMEHLVAGD